MSPKSVPCPRCAGTGRIPDLRDVGRRLRLARKGALLGLREAARQAKISAEYLRDLEKGRGTFRGEGAQRVLALLRVDP